MSRKTPVVTTPPPRQETWVETLTEMLIAWLCVREHQAAPVKRVGANAVQRGTRYPFWTSQFERTYRDRLERATLPHWPGNHLGTANTSKTEAYR